MIRRRYGRALTRAAADTGEDVNPNAYTSNIADCMLVLVVGLLVALVARYGLELQQPEDDPDKIVGIEVNMDADGDGEIDRSYQQAGTVYLDQETGQYYLVQE